MHMPSSTETQITVPMKPITRSGEAERATVRPDMQATQPMKRVNREAAQDVLPNDSLHQTREADAPTPFIDTVTKRQSKYELDSIYKELLEYELVSLSTIEEEHVQADQSTQLQQTIMFFDAQKKEDQTVDARVAQALTLANERHLLPISATHIQLLIRMLLFVEKMKSKYLKSEYILDRLRHKSARGWWFWHMVSEGQVRSKEKRQHSIVGKSGCWFADASLEKPLSLQSRDHVIQAVSSMVSGLVASHSHTMKELSGLHSTLAFQAMRDTHKNPKYQDGGVRLEPFAQRLNPKNTVVKPEQWLEFVAQNGMKEFGAYFSQKDQEIAFRTQEELQTIAIHIDTAHAGKRTLWYKIPPKQPTKREIELEIRHMMQQNSTDVGNPVVHPVFEIVLPPEKTDISQELQLQGVSETSPVAKVVLHQEVGKRITKLRWVFPHLTANESDGWRIIQHVCRESNAHLTVDQEEVQRPQIIDVMKGKRKTYKDKRGRKHKSDIKEVETISGAYLTESENSMYHEAQKLLKSQDPSIKVTTAQLVALAQNMITPEGTYVCVAANKNDLQLTEVPSGESQHMRSLFHTFEHILTEVSKVGPVTPEALHAWKSASQKNAEMLDQVVREFPKALEETTTFVNKDIEECQHGRGMLSVLETYISSLSRSALRVLVPSATAVLESCSSQVSLVSHKEPQLVRFVSALSQTVSTAIGGFSYVDEHGKMKRVLTTRYRADQTDIQRLVSAMEAQQGSTPNTIEHLILEDAHQRVSEVRKNLAVLCLCIDMAYGKQEQTSRIAPHFSRSWRAIQMDRVPFLY